MHDPARAWPSGAPELRVLGVEEVEEEEEEEQYSSGWSCMEGSREGGEQEAI